MDVFAVLVLKLFKYKIKVQKYLKRDCGLQFVCCVFAIVLKQPQGKRCCSIQNALCEKYQPENAA